MLLFLVTPFVEDLSQGNLIEAALVTLVMVFAVLAVGGHGRTLALLLVAPALVAKWANHLRPGLVPPEIFLVASMLFFAFVIAHLLRFILRAPRVDANVPCAGISGYLMLGLLWVPAYLLAAQLSPAAFALTAGPDAGRSLDGFPAFSLPQNPASQENSSRLPAHQHPRACSRWSYALSATAPFMWADVSANVTLGPKTGKISSSVNGLGDIVLMPLMLNYNINSNLNANFRTGIYAPTGDYEVGRLANTGKNFWTIEPTLALMYFGVNNGREASIFVGADFNTENPDTHYQSGTQFHVYGTLAQHFPLFGELAGVGVNGFWYGQITGDSGSGANFGDFEGQTTGVGPVLSYVFKLGKVDMIAEAK